jgi:hypothetical protein
VFSQQKFIVAIFNYFKLGLCAISTKQMTHLNIAGLKTEYYTNPVGIDNLNPRLSWLSGF